MTDPIPTQRLACHAIAPLLDICWEVVDASLSACLLLALKFSIKEVIYSYLQLFTVIYSYL